jgi:hypothetical protein
MRTHHPDDGGSKHLWNVGKRLPDYRAQQPRRHQLNTYHRDSLKSHKLLIIRLFNYLFLNCLLYVAYNERFVIELERKWNDSSLP